MEHKAKIIKVESMKNEHIEMISLWATKVEEETRETLIFYQKPDKKNEMLRKLMISCNVANICELEGNFVNVESTLSGAFYVTAAK